MPILIFQHNNVSIQQALFRRKIKKSCLWVAPHDSHSVNSPRVPEARPHHWAKSLHSPLCHFLLRTYLQDLFDISWLWVFHLQNRGWKWRPQHQIPGWKWKKINVTNTWFLTQNYVSSSWIAQEIAFPWKHHTLSREGNIYSGAIAYSLKPEQRPNHIVGHFEILPQCFHRKG